MMAKKDKILIVGVDSFIGKSLAKHCFANKIKFIGTTRRLKRVNDINKFLDLNLEPSLVWFPNDFSTAIICAGITSIEYCQKNPELSRNVNVINTVKLIELLIKRDVTVIFPSTNLVFNGLIPFIKPHEDQIPTCEYGSQKAEVEKRLLEKCDKKCIIRFSKVVDKNMSLINSWISNMEGNKIISPFSDVSIAPIPLQFAIKVIITVIKRKTYGIIQVSGGYELTYSDLAHLIAEYYEYNKSLINPVLSNDSIMKTKYNTMNTDRLNKELGLITPDLEFLIKSLLN